MLTKDSSLWVELALQKLAAEKQTDTQERREREKGMETDSTVEY